MKHLTSIIDIERTIANNCLCLFYIKSPDCGVCNEGEAIYFLMNENKSKEMGFLHCDVEDV